MFGFIKNLVHNINRASANVYWMEVYLIQTRNKIQMYVGVSVKNYMIRVPAMMIIWGILVHVIVSVIWHVKLTNI